MAMHPLALLPELLLLVGALSALVLGSFVPRRRQWLPRLVAVAALLASGAAAGVGLAGPVRLVYSGTFTVDTATGVVRLVVAASTLLVIGLGVDELADDVRESETYALLLLSAAGAMLLAGASDLLVLAVAFLLTSVPLYGLIGLPRTPGAGEAALKTYLLGALFGIVMLLGVTLLYGLAGGTTYAELGQGLGRAPSAALAVGVVAVLGGLLFESGAVPAHFWVPDAAQGTGATAAAFLTTVPKVGALLATYRFVDALPGPLRWWLLVGVVAAASMTLGNLAAYSQRDPRRLLGWSTVSQVGYLLLPVAVAGHSDLARPALLVYLAAYAVTNLGAFAVTAAFPQRRDLSAYRGLGRSRPALAAALLVCLLGLVGTPPTAVFAGKLLVSAAAWDGGAAWLVVVLVVNSVASLFYYLRWIAPLYERGLGTERTARGAFVPRPWAARAAVAAAVCSVVLGVLTGLASRLAAS
nr:proton-conducting transporter membrane subunit [Angustibacter sp. Root456]